MTASVVSIRQEWEAGDRRFVELERDPKRHELLHAGLETIDAELRRRVGQTFTVAQLAELYGSADRWMLPALEEELPGTAWLPLASAILDSAFHRYARRAMDYQP